VSHSENMYSEKFTDTGYKAECYVSSIKLADTQPHELKTW